MREGLRIEYRVSPLGFPQRWISEITRWEPPGAFVDEQRVGPYRRWRHLHRFVAREGGTEVIDEVDYQVPLGPVGRAVEAVLVAPRLAGIFDYRAAVIGARFEGSR
jgi:ligand-binding SRPBCC domain-containing protein